MTTLELILTALGSAGGSAVLVKWQHRGVDKATAEKIQAEARAIAVQSTNEELRAVRELLDDYRQSEARKTGLIADLERRIDKLEERERHALTRAAVHEAWDQLAFQFIAGHDASFPPPPPLAAHRPALPAATDTPDDN